MTAASKAEVEKYNKNPHCNISRAPNDPFLQIAQWSEDSKILQQKRFSSGAIKQNSIFMTFIDTLSPYMMSSAPRLYFQPIFFSSNINFVV